jgi:ribose 5-phosphate isomerase B
MLIYIGADHGGFPMKEFLKIYLKDKGYETADMGNTKLDPQDDYPDFAAAVAKKVSMDPQMGRGILICRSGAGVDIVANKFRDVRSGLGISPDQVFHMREHDDINILSIASDFTAESDAQKMVTVFLETPYTGEARHQRRIDKISEIESKRE